MQVSRQLSSLLGPEGLPRFGEVVFFFRCQYVPLFRHGQSMYNEQQRLGGDSELTDCGQLYSTQLGKYINELQVTMSVYHTVCVSVFLFNCRLRPNG